MYLFNPHTLLFIEDEEKKNIIRKKQKTPTTFNYLIQSNQTLFRHKKILLAPDAFI